MHQHHLARKPMGAPVWLRLIPAALIALVLLFSWVSLSGSSAATSTDGDGSTTISGELKEWHKVTLDLAGPHADEQDTLNPFLTYRMDVTFTNGAYTYVVPGYFAADGNASETSATSGNVWRAHLSPDITGTWHYTVSFISGTHASTTGVGSPLAPFDGATGSFEVTETDKTGRDFRGKGRLEYVNQRYLQFAGTGEYFVKAGADSPENFMNYLDIDGTTSDSTTDRRRDWADHVADWETGDPTWQNGKGKGMIGAINYLASEGVNVFSFITFNAGGDSRDVWPFISSSSSDWTRYDVSKLDQWAIIFDHATSKGMYLHFKTQETENDTGEKALDGGDVDVERTLYYRELVARFGHNLALNWNLGEENGQSEEQRRASAQAIHDVDPYDHNIVMHTFPLGAAKSAAYGPLLGSNSELTGASLQSKLDEIHEDTIEWVDRSQDAGKPWVVANDEQGRAQDGIPPDAGWPGYSGGGPSRQELRHKVLYGNLMAGGAGIEAYFGYDHPDDDINLDDFRSRDEWWDYNKYAIDFFQGYLPFTEMSSCDALTNSNDSWCFGKHDELVAIYLPDGGSETVDLSGQLTETVQIEWFNPRSGGWLQSGSIAQTVGGTSISTGTPPSDTSLDWIVLIHPADTPLPTAEVVRFNLINADTGTIIQPLQNGDTIVLADMPTQNLNVEAIVGQVSVESVRFGLNNDANFNVANVAPYALTGITGTTFNAWNPAEGFYTLTATPYEFDNEGGGVGDPQTISFTVVTDSTSTPPPPTPTSTPDPSATGTPTPSPTPINIEDLTEKNYAPFINKP